MFFCLILLANCLIQKYSSADDFKSYNYIVSDINTVFYVRTKLMEKNNDVFTTVKEGDLSTSLKVYRADIAEENLVMHDKKSDEENTFFFTTPAKNTYILVLQIDSRDGMILQNNIGIEANIYSGDTNRPSIVSNSDVELSRAEGWIKRMSDFIEKNILIQDMGDQDKNVFRDLYEQIMKKVIFFILIKFFLSGFTMYYSNYMTKCFYTSKGVISSK